MILPAIFEVNFQAFAHYDEANLVNTLRDSNIFNPELSLVAVCGDRIIGHIMFPPVTIESPLASTPAVALAPLVVHPDYQCLGVGSALVEEGLNACRSFGHRIVIVVGHPGYYPRYGFRSARELMVSWHHLLLLMMYSWYSALSPVHLMEFRVPYSIRKHLMQLSASGLTNGEKINLLS